MLVWNLTSVLLFGQQLKNIYSAQKNVTLWEFFHSGTSWFYWKFHLSLNFRSLLDNYLLKKTMLVDEKRLHFEKVFLVQLIFSWNRKLRYLNNRNYPFRLSNFCVQSTSKSSPFRSKRNDKMNSKQIQKNLGKFPKIRFFYPETSNS